MNFDSEKFISMYMNPNTKISDIMREFKISRSTVYSRAASLGLPKVERSVDCFRSFKGLKPRTKEKIEEFVEDWRTLSKEELIDKYQVSWETLKNWGATIGKGRPVSTNLNRKKQLEYINSEKYLNGEMPSYEKLIDLAIRNSELIGGYLFTPVIMENEIVTDRPIALTFTSDWHIGGMGVDYVQLDIDINTIEQTEGLYCYIGGDLRDNFIEPSTTGSGLNQSPIAWQKMLFIRSIEKLKDKIVAIGKGNHDWDTWITGADWIAEFARSLKIIYTDVGGLLKLKVGNQVYNIFRTHKFKFHSILNLTHACKQLWRLGEYDADIVVIEHRHAAAIEKFYGHGLERIGIRTGTYKVADDYARKNGFYGLTVKNPTVILYPNERKMVEFLDMYDAIIHLKAVRNSIGGE